ncbi:Vesicle-associated membrane protein 1 [Myotis davidii]|uniref:Vesicle-associated membrane protein 1 n=1 Tax=Myotis davidii TaxID=225400 RepID=L5MAX5_MYODS|nr:Vesicle-associated membrane protein 1 [Myotis davidii]
MEMAHCSSGSDAGNYARAQPPDLTTPSEEGSTPLLHQPQPAPHGRGRGAGVVDIMRVNVDKVLKRDEILSELDDRADALQMGASQFESSAAKLKRKYWWKNCKMMIMLGVICAIIVVVIASLPDVLCPVYPRQSPEGTYSISSLTQKAGRVLHMFRASAP